VRVEDAGEPAMVKLVEPTGHESIVFFETHGVVVTGRVGAEVGLRAGDAVRVGFRKAKLHVFDRATGLRLNSDGPSRVASFRGLQSIGTR
jgi:multiple sugar transport system ATP-binding protein